MDSVLLKELEDLRAENAYLRKELHKLQEQTKHNARGAGRKPANDAWVAGYTAFCEALAAGKSKQEIMIELAISERTYYRHLRLKRDTDC